MIISQRLKTITECAVKCEFLVDVGTDHAYIPIFLVKNKIAKKAVACDISEGSVFKAEKNIRSYHYSDFIETRVGDGLSVIKKDECPDQIIIAGMGGMLTIDILNNDKEIISRAERIILQPQRNIDKVRRAVHNLDLKIIDEKMIFETGKYYNVIVCEKGRDFAYNEKDYIFGKILLERGDELLKSQIHFETLKIINILKSMEEKISKGKRDEAFIKRYEELKLKRELYIQGRNVLHKE
ncbi:MAG: SAM-dependent methyltransferase [Clostridiales bacterium]|nr:SAM-dependent methyltransferase [Clostridiales bacterium]